MTENERKIENESQDKIPATEFQWEPHIPYKKEGEDSLFKSANSFVVADGVTRSKNEQGEYPYPSPAKQVSKAAAEAMGNFLSKQEMTDEQDITLAFAEGNAAAKQVNEQLGLWENHDYLARDFAGTVVACATVKNGEILYGYIGDCGVAHISASGELVWHTNDDVMEARKDFPPTEKIKGNERVVAVRRDFRNNPTPEHKTYGVLTGEDKTMEYVKTGRLPYEPGDALLVYSDGISPFIYEDADFRKLILQNDQQKIREYVTERSSPEKNFDEKTLIVIQPEK